MSDRTPSANPIGVSGVVQHGGIIYQHDEYDRAWKGAQRDRTISDMLNDPLIGSVLLGIEMLMRRVEWTVQAADESDAAIDQAEFVTSCLADMEGYWPGDTLAQVLSFLGWGWSCMEVTYKRRGGPDGTTPSRHDDGMIGWHRWGMRPQSTRYGWVFDGNEPTALIQQDPMTFQRYTIPLDRCMLFRYTSRSNSPEGTTPLRVAFDAWYYKRQLQKIEAIGIERDLAGLPVYYLPARDIQQNTPAYQSAQQIVTGIRNDSQAGAVIPGDRDEHGQRYQELTLLSTGGQRAFDTDTIIRRYANEVVTAFLANVLRTGQDGVGAFALSETQSGLFQQAIGAHLDTIADTITDQGIMPLVKLNGFDPALAPSLQHGDIESADLERLGTYLGHLATAGMLADTPELRAFLHNVAGLPVPSVEEIEEQQEEDEEAADAMQEAIAGGGGNDTSEDDDTDDAQEGE